MNSESSHLHDFVQEIADLSFFMVMELRGKGCVDGSHNKESTIDTICTECYTKMVHTKFLEFDSCKEVTENLFNHVASARQKDFFEPTNKKAEELIKQIETLTASLREQTSRMPVRADEKLNEETAKRLLDTVHGLGMIIELTKIMRIENDNSSLLEELKICLADNERQIPSSLKTNLKEVKEYITEV